MSDRLTALAQSILPRRALTEAVGRVARARVGTITTAMIRLFVRRFAVNLAEADVSDPRGYACFNDFFVRALRSDARPIDPASLVSPVDGRISQFGAIADGQIYQAKGHGFSTVDLLGGDSIRAGQYRNGRFANRPIAVGHRFRGIATVWHGTVNAPRPAHLRHWTYDQDTVALRKGQEMGRFLMGSTVIMLFASGDMRFNPCWHAAGAVQLGEMMAHID